MELLWEDAAHNLALITHMWMRDHEVPGLKFSMIDVAQYEAQANLARDLDDLATARCRNNIQTSIHVSVCMYTGSDFNETIEGSVCTPVATSMRRLRAQDKVITFVVVSSPCGSSSKLSCAILIVLYECAVERAQCAGVSQ